MAYGKKKPESNKMQFKPLPGFEDVEIRAAYKPESGGFGTLRVGPVDIKFSIFIGNDGPYALFPSYKAKDGTYKKQVFLDADLHTAVNEYINTL